MAYPYTRSRARGEVADSDIEPSDTAPSAATSPLPLSISVRPNVEAVEGPESVSTESAGPVSALTYPLPAGSHSSSGGLGVSGPVGPPQVGVSALGYPSGLAGPPESSMHSREQVSSSVATVIVESSSPCSSLAVAPTLPAAASIAAAARRHHRDGCR